MHRTIIDLERDWSRITTEALLLAVVFGGLGGLVFPDASGLQVVAGAIWLGCALALGLLATFSTWCWWDCRSLRAELERVLAEQELP